MKASARVNKGPLRRARNGGPKSIGGPAGEITIRLEIEKLPEGVYLATSPDVPGLVAEGRSVVEAAEIAQGLTRKIVESCLEHGDPLPPALAHAAHEPIKLVVPVAVR